VSAEDCLKLTTYFGERDRAGGRLLADALLDLYERHEVPMSVLLRGAAGFGRRHQLRTDALLSLSEDLPVVSVAVDTHQRIDRILPEVLALTRKGLLTLERARLLSGPLTPEAASAVALSAAAPGQEAKLTIYVGRQERIDRRLAFVALCDLLREHGLLGATVLLGVDGVIAGRRARAGFLSRNSEVPMMVISVGPATQIARALPGLGALRARPTMTLERVRVCKRDGELLAGPHELPGTDEHGLALWQKLMIHTSESSRHDGHPVHRQIVQRLRRANVAGATSVRGVWGFHGAHAPHGDRLLQIRRRVPVVTTVVDRPERIEDAFSIIDELTSERGLVTSEMVPAAASMAPGRPSRGGTRLARHDLGG
jgi:PII-like signaling protein